MEPWDKSGIDFGQQIKKDVKKIVVALDLNSHSLEKALEYDADMIVIHHPFFWEENREEEYEINPYKKNLYEKAIWKGLICYSMHTNYDNAKDGMWMQVARNLGFKKIINENKYGVRIDEATNTKKVLELLKNKNIKVKDKSVTPKQEFDSIVIYPGSGDMKSIVKSAQIPNTLIISSDKKWSEWMTINEMNINFIEVEHSIEDAFVEHVAKVIKNEFKEIQLIKVNVK